MIKSLFFQAIKIGVILVIGQMPYGKSTVGGEFVALLKEGAEKAIELSKGSSKKASKKIRKKLNTEKGFDLEKAKKAFLPENRMGE